MAPVAHVLVYYVRDDGEIVADSLDVELEGTLQNFVSFVILKPSDFPNKKILLLRWTSERQSMKLVLGIM